MDVIRGPITVTGLTQLRHNTHLTIYPDGSGQMLVADRDIFLARGWEDATKWGKKKKRVETFLDDVDCDFYWEQSQYWYERADAALAERKLQSVARAQRRAKRALRDLARSNSFRWFVTLTLDSTKVDRYDAAVVVRKLNRWLDNMVRRRGLAYIVVPERHKDGAIHFHGLFTDNVDYAFSGHYDGGGHPIYNLPQWTLGFTTAIELYGDRDAAIGYVTKYISKQVAPAAGGDSAPPVPRKIAGRWYYSGGDLRRPAVTVTTSDFSAISRLPDAYKFTIKDIDVRVVSIRIHGGLCYGADVSPAAP